MEPFTVRSTTILGVRGGKKIALGGDGQVTMGDMLMKSKAIKVRSFCDGKVLAGFAGAVADAMALFEKFEGKLTEVNGNLQKAVVEMAKDWRTDRYLRRLEAMMAVSDINTSLVLTGTGDGLEPEDGLIGIGSGGSFALAAARALIDRDDMGAEDIARRAMQIAAGICVYTNENLTGESLKPEDSV